MSWEEDYLMRAMREVIAVLRGLDLLDECAGADGCGTVFARDLPLCPNCQRPNQRLSEDESPEEAEESRPSYSAMSVDSLKSELDRRAIFYPNTAKKADLIALLEENDRVQAEPPL